MNGYILLISIICFSIGFSSFALSFFLFEKYKNKNLLLYSVCMGLWSLNVFLIRILDILRLQFWNIDESSSLVTSILSNITWGLFNYFFLLTAHSFAGQKLNRKWWSLLLLSSLFLMVPMDVITMDYKMKSIFIYLQIGIHSIILYKSAFILKTIVVNFTKKNVRSMYNRFINFLLFFFPFFIVDLLPITIKKFQFGLGFYPLFYLLVNLFFLRFISNFVYFPKLAEKRIPYNSNHDNIYSLTKRELEIADLILEGRSYREISEQLIISQETVKTHISNIYKKTNVSNKIELATALAKS
ncbi:response regulator transcription factor [Spirochaeta cellobiosiphila]|uniref:response regulator transcription factor n=1 Tax=Spirochaeta cellobiosiphila TaxID=504483 RepID=UPI0004266520|nr:LuxR C-terminal-related transcriptional regulator [Spirochaeta cellobiosiphila]